MMQALEKQKTPRGWGLREVFVSLDLLKGQFLNTPAPARSQVGFLLPNHGRSVSMILRPLRKQVEENQKFEANHSEVHSLRAAPYALVSSRMLRFSDEKWSHVAQGRP